MEANVERGFAAGNVRADWWGMIAHGVIFILFGIAAILWPGISLAILIMLFGVFVLVDGIIDIAAAITTRHWWPLLFIGLLGIATGIVTFAYPGLTLVMLLYIIAAWAVVRGIFEFIAAFAAPVLSGSGRFLLVLAGLISVLFGIILFSYPLAGLLAVVWLIGFYALIYGLTEIVLGLEFRGYEQQLRGAVQH